MQILPYIAQLLYISRITWGTWRLAIGNRRLAHGTARTLVVPLTIVSGLTKGIKMKATRIATAATLLVTGILALQLAWAQDVGNKAASENRKEQSHMTNNKVIMLIEARIQPQRRAELIAALNEYLPLVRAEPGVEAFYVTARQDDPNSVVFYEVYKSQAAQDFHLQQDFTKKFLATLKSAQAADRVRTKLVEFVPE